MGKANKNWGEGLRRVSAVIFGVLGVLGFGFGLGAAITWFNKNSSEVLAGLLFASLSPVFAVGLHNLLCRTVSWVVEGFAKKESS